VKSLSQREALQDLPQNLVIVPPVGERVGHLQGRRAGHLLVGKAHILGVKVILQPDVEVLLAPEEKVNPQPVLVTVNIHHQEGVQEVDQEAGVKAIGRETKIKVMSQTKKIGIVKRRERSERRKTRWRGMERNHLVQKYLEIMTKKKRALILLRMIKMAVNRVKQMEVLEKTGMQVMTKLILKIWIFQLHLNFVVI
jgi:hypothetical protein